MPHAHNFRNLTGERFGRLVVLSYEGLQRDRRESIYKCRCDCGTVFVTAGRSLVHGATRSCGCIRKERAAALAKSINHNTTPVRVLGPDEQVSFYESQTAAAQALGCSHKTVWGCVKTGRRFQGKYLIQRAK